MDSVGNNLYTDFFYLLLLRVNAFVVCLIWHFSLFWWVLLFLGNEKKVMRVFAVVDFGWGANSGGKAGGVVLLAVSTLAGRSFCFLSVLVKLTCQCHQRHVPIVRIHEHSTNHGQKKDRPFSVGTWNRCMPLKDILFDVFPCNTLPWVHHVEVTQLSHAAFRVLNQHHRLGHFFFTALVSCQMSIAGLWSTI